MRIARSFDPLEAGGEIDSFAFDFTPDLGDSTLTGTTWTCALAPSATGTDPDPQSRVISATLATHITLRNTDNSVTIRNGGFSIAMVGGFPTTMEGSDYVLEATVTTSDGRVLKLNANVRCQAPGYT